MDRYGEIPQPVKNLLQIAYIKSLAKACGFSSVQEKNDTVIFQYSESKNINLRYWGNSWTNTEENFFSRQATDHISPLRQQE